MSWYVHTLASSINLIFQVVSDFFIAMHKWSFDGNLHGLIHMNGEWSFPFYGNANLSKHAVPPWNAVITSCQVVADTGKEIHPVNVWVFRRVPIQAPSLSLLSLNVILILDITLVRVLREYTTSPGESMHMLSRLTLQFRFTEKALFLYQPSFVSSLIFALL